MSDHVANGVGYRLLTGNKYTWFNKLKAGANAGLPEEMWLLLRSIWISIRLTRFRLGGEIRVIYNTKFDLPA